jgi:vanillate O-demethylase monooxygenase subunit
MFLRNAWYVAALDHEIGRALLPRTIMDDNIVFFRAEDGSVAALEDRCCHRQAPLSAGRLIGDRVECGYHGLVFDRSGRCVGVPGQAHIPPRALVRAYPVIERHRWIGRIRRPPMSRSIPALPSRGPARLPATAAAA